MVFRTILKTPVTVLFNSITVHLVPHLSIILLYSLKISLLNIYHLRPISLTPVLSKLAEDFLVDRYVKPAVLAKVDPRQFGTVPGSSTTEALISMTHAWYSATDGNGASVRVILFDFKKAFDLIDYRILVRKLGTFNIPDAVIS